MKIKKKLNLDLPITKRGEGINPIDAHVGKQLRIARDMGGLSQEVLAASVGITFQQLQKYECGRNRVSASRLLQLADVLKLSVLYFFEGFGNQSERTSFLDSPDNIRMLSAFEKISNPVIKQRMIELMEAAL